MDGSFVGICPFPHSYSLLLLSMRMLTQDCATLEHSEACQSAVVASHLCQKVIKMCAAALAAAAEAPAVSGDSSDTDSSDATAKIVSTDSCENDSSSVAASGIRTASGRSSTDTE
jgi:hypothetical protein